MEDTAIALQALAGHDPEDPVSLPGPFPDYRAALEGGVEGVKVGVLEEFVGSGCTEEVERAVRRAVAALSDMGAEVEEVSIEGAAGVSDIHKHYSRAGIGGLLQGGVSAGEDGAD